MGIASRTEDQSTRLPGGFGGSNTAFLPFLTFRSPRRGGIEVDVSVVVLTAVQVRFLPQSTTIKISRAGQAVPANETRMGGDFHGSRWVEWLLASFLALPSRPFLPSCFLVESPSGGRLGSRLRCPPLFEPPSSLS